jgi:hypothetical protein
MYVIIAAIFLANSCSIIVARRSKLRRLLPQAFIMVHYTLCLRAVRSLQLCRPQFRFFICSIAAYASPFPGNFISHCNLRFFGRA